MSTIKLDNEAIKLKGNIASLDSKYIGSGSNYFKFLHDLINHDYASIPNVPKTAASSGIISQDDLTKINENTFTYLLITSLMFNIDNIKIGSGSAIADNNNGTVDSNILKFVRGPNDPSSAVSVSSTTIMAAISGESPLVQADTTSDGVHINVKPETAKVLNIVSSINVLNIFIDILEAYEHAIQKDGGFKADVDEVKHIFIVNKNARPSGLSAADSSLDNFGFYLKNSDKSNYMTEGKTLFLSINSYQIGAGQTDHNHLFKSLIKYDSISNFQNASNNAGHQNYNKDYEVSETGSEYLFNHTGGDYDLNSVNGIEGYISAYHINSIKASTAPTHEPGVAFNDATSTDTTSSYGTLFKLRDKYLIETFVKDIFNIQISKRRETIKALLIICKILKQFLLLSVSGCNLLFNSIFKYADDDFTSVDYTTATSANILNQSKATSTISGVPDTYRYYIINNDKIYDVDSIKGILYNLYDDISTNNNNVVVNATASDEDILLNEPSSAVTFAGVTDADEKEAKYFENSVWYHAFKKHEMLKAKIEDSLNTLYTDSISNAGIYTGDEYTINDGDIGFVIEVIDEKTLKLHHPDFLYDKIYNADTSENGLYKTIQGNIGLNVDGSGELQKYFTNDDITAFIKTTTATFTPDSSCSYKTTLGVITTPEPVTYSNVNGFTINKQSDKNTADYYLYNSIENNNYYDITKNISEWGIIINGQAFHIKNIKGIKTASVDSNVIESITIEARLDTKVKSDTYLQHIPELRLNINKQYNTATCASSSNDNINKPYTIFKNFKGKNIVSSIATPSEEYNYKPENLKGMFILVRAGEANKRFNQIKFAKLNKSNIKDKYNLSKLQLVDTNNKINNYETKIKNYNTLYEYNNNKNSILSNSYISYLVIVSVLIIALLFTYVNDTDNSIKKLIAIICFSIIILLFIVYFIFNTLYIEEKFIGYDKTGAAVGTTHILNYPDLSFTSDSINSHDEFNSTGNFINDKRNYVHNGLKDIFYEASKILTISNVAISAVGENKANEELRRIITKETSLRTGIKTKLSNISNGSTSEIDLLKYEREIYEVKIKTILMMGLLFSGLYTINLYTNGVFAESLIYIGLLLFIIIMSYYLIYSSNVVRTRSNNIYWGKMNINKYKSI